MIKLTRIAIILLILTSCNSDKKKKDTIDYPDKTSLSQTSAELKASVERGKITYNDMCITCHMANGKGVSKVFPPLADSDYLRNNQTKSILGVKNGMSGEITVNGETYNTPMAPLGLSDEEVADVMNYINNSWGNKVDNFVTAEKVSNL
jgi:mono/diheme cytochrome c family protein